MKFKFDDEEIRKIRLIAMKEIYKFNEDGVKEFFKRLQELELEDLK